jgi:hypothetical protein
VAVRWDTFALGRTRATRHEIGGGAEVEIRATSWIVRDVP